MRALRQSFCAFLAAWALLGLACGSALGHPVEAGGAFRRLLQANRVLAAGDAASQPPTPLRAGGHAAAPHSRALVLAVAGDAAQWPSWLANATCGQRSFDLALIYYGASPFFGCSACVRVWNARGAKWNLLYKALQAEESWQLVGSYDAVMLADDDLRMTAADIDVAFELFFSHHLDLAQLSICRHNRSTSAWDIVFQRPGSLLRFTNFVEVMAPIVSRGFLPQLRTLLEDSYTGWGLDFLLPYLLGYPRDRIAVIDAACMVHPQGDAAGEPGRPARQRMYSADLPRTPREEWDFVLRKYGMNNSSVAGRGLPFGEAQTYRTVPSGAGTGRARNTKCGDLSTLPASRLPARQAAGQLPLLRLAGWLLQTVLASCGGLLLAIKAVEAVRGRRHAGSAEGSGKAGRPAGERSPQRSSPRMLVLKQ